MLYLICYDIVDDRRRQRTAKYLQGYGLRVQKSVFECVLNRDQYEMVQKKLTKILKAKEDQLRFYPMNEHCRKKVTILGLQPDYNIDDATFIV